MASFNRVILVGNLTADPEQKITPNGITACAFSIAVNRPKSKDGTSAVDYFNIQTWRQAAEYISRYGHKGKSVLVCGKLQTRSWVDAQGNKRNAIEINADEVALMGNRSDNDNTVSEPTPVSKVPNMEFSELGDDDLPF